MLRVGLVTLIYLLLAAGCTSPPPQNGYIFDGNSTYSAPPGYVELCHRDPASMFCKAKLRREFDLLRKKFRQVREKNREDLWENKLSEIKMIGYAYGDCEDFALTLVNIFIELGVKRGNISLIFGVIGGGVGHVVTGVTLGDEMIIYDNMWNRPHLLNWYTHYTPKSYMNMAEPGTWRRIRQESTDARS